MPSLRLTDRLIWFAHCPKAGGTSVEQFMVATWGDAVGHLHWGWDLWWRNGGWRVADPPNSPQHLIWNDALATLGAPPDLVFAVVRDPVTRMASEQRWQRHGRRGTWVGKMFAFLPFALWLRLMLATAKRYPHCLDNHFRRQSDFVPEEAKVFLLEDGLEKVADWLAETAGSVQPGQAFPHAIRTEGRMTIGAAEAALIGAFFVEDYHRFGYPRPRAGTSRPVLDACAAALAPLVAALDRRGGI